MRCGAKRYRVKIKADGEKPIKSIIARTPAEARKYTRKEYGATVQILSVREEKRKYN